MRILWAALVSIILLSTIASAQVPENLDEMFARKSRISSGSYAYNVSLLENASRNYIWQPETFMYTDVQTGHEVWRLSSTPNLNNYYQMDIGVSPWSADGKRLAFTGYRRYTKAYDISVETRDGGNTYIWMISDTDGDNLRPALGSPRRIGGGYFHWSPQVPDTFYETGAPYFFPWAERPNSSTIFKCLANDTGISSTPLLVYSFAGPDIGKYISPDGRKIIPNRWMSDSEPYMLYPSTIYPESQARIDVPAGYSQDRDFGPYGDTPNPILRYHDAYYAGDGSWYFGMPTSSGGSWWRIKTLGSASDGGGLYTGDLIPPSDQPPYDFGEVWPENHGGVTLGGHISSPWVQDNPYTPSKTCYWSHFVPDMWGRYALYSAACDDLPKGYGPGVWDIQNHSYSVASFGGGAQHHDWHGFTDYVVSSSPTPDYLSDKILSAKYNDINSQFTVCYTHTRYNGGAEYNSLTRPGQSPDGTKVAWHSEFLNPGASMTDIFWAVVYYPYPPTNLSAFWNNGVRLSWLPPKYTERGWPYANATVQKDSLGWPLLDANGREIGEPVYAREIKRYHIWRSSSQSGPWQEVGTTNAQYSYTYTEDPSMLMLHPIANGFKVSESNKISYTDNPGDGTFYYALTSEEHSGLESDELSEILEVTVSGTSVASQIVQPKGQKSFWTASPQSPTNFQYNATGVSSQYSLSWSEPTDSKVRYYNIYYSNSSNPATIQQQRIASVPKGTYSYLDWLADPSNPGYYGITSVDRYGNEGSIVLGGGPVCIHKSDSNPCDGCVSQSELFAFIDLWYVNSSDPTLKELIEAIGLWKMGSCP